MAVSPMAIAMRPSSGLSFPTGRANWPLGCGRRRTSAAVVASVSGGRTRIQRLIEEDGIVLMPGCYDALSAAIIQKSGFRAGFISGYALSASLIGKPDFGLLTPPEMAETAGSVCAASPLIPIIADADTGGGNALNVQRTVKDLIAAGVAGCFLEDQAWPKKCGHMCGKQVIPAEEHAVKIASARDAIGDADFFLVARTDARAISVNSGLSDAIARANLYMEGAGPYSWKRLTAVLAWRERSGLSRALMCLGRRSGLFDQVLSGPPRHEASSEAGADACFVEAPRDDDELREIGRRTNGFRVCNMIEGGITPLHTPQELQETGFHLIVHPLTTL